MTITPELAIILSITLAREIRQALEAKKDLTDEEIAILIYKNLVKISSIKATIEEEIKKFGG